MDKQNATTLELMEAALKQITDVLEKAEEHWNVLNQKISQARDQRISLASNKQMLAELIARAKQLNEANTLTPPKVTNE
jgi:phage shock protein A